MIVFKKIKVNNFMAHGKVEFDFVNGVHFVEGINRDDESADSNGAGKTTLFEALVWCLYGFTTKNGKSGDEVVNRFSDGGKNCAVMVEIEKGGQSAKVFRFRKHTKQKNRLVFMVDGVDRTAATNQQTQEELVSWLGLNYDIFTRVVLCPQKRTGKAFAELTDAEAKEFFDTFLNISKWSVPVTLARNDVKTAETRIQQLDNESAQVESKIETATAAIERNQNAKKSWEENRQIRIQDLRERIKAIEAVIKQDGAKVIEDETKLDQEKYEKDKLELSDLGMRIRGLENERGASMQLLQTTAQLRQKLEAISEAIEKEGEPESDVDEVSAIQSLERKRSEITAAARSKTEIESAIRDLVARKNKERSRLESASSATCPTCGQTMHDETRDRVRAKIESDVSEYEKTIQEKKVALAKVPIHTSDDVKKIEADIKALSDRRGKKERRQALVSQRAAIEAQYYEMPEPGDVRTINEEIGRLTVRGKELSEWAKTYERAASDILRAKDRLASLQTDKASLEKEEAKVTAECYPNEREFQYLSDSITTLNEQLAEIIVKKKSIYRKLEIARFWAVGFSNAGIRNMLLEEVMPVLNEYVSHFAAKIAPAHAIELTNKAQTKDGESREKFGVKVSNRFGAETIDLGSGGESTRVDMAILFALQKFNQARHERVNLSVYDETFHMVDITGVERLVATIQEESVDRAVYVISHDTRVGAQMPSVVTFVKENGITSLRG